MNPLKLISEYFINKSKSLLITINIALLLCIGLVDYITGYEIAMSLFYLIPISFTAWFGSRTQSIVVSFLSVLIIAATDFMTVKEFPHIFIELWNLLMYLGFFTIYAVVLSLVKSDLNERNRLLEELQETLHEVKQLSGLLPICASCKKIRDDKGYWNQIESYICSRSEVQFSHGICPECFKKLYSEEHENNFDNQGKKTEKGQ